MNIGRGLALSVLAAGVGAGVWVGVYAGTGYSVGLLAIIIGGLAGFGMGMGSGGRGGALAGVLAAAVTFVAVCGARLGVAHLHASSVLAEGMTITEEDAEAAIASELYVQWEEEGREMSEPDEDEEFPAEVLAAASRRWRLMGDLERAEFVAGLRTRRSEDAAAAAPVLTGLSFVFGFGVMGFVCLGLAMSTAYKIGSSVVQKKTEEREGGLTVESVEPAQGNLGVFARLGQTEAEKKGTPGQRAA